jgi:predicted unusual protein kinase regulating ubiquinone biosynthesis (AarF/ABC1/UbiB family)
MLRRAMAEDDDPEGSSRKPAGGGPASGRFARFARLSSLTAGVTARHVAQRIASTFQSDEDAERSEKKAMERSAARIVETLGDLKGAAMKVGQLLATDPELLPEEVAAQLATLQHSAPPMDAATVRAVVAEALGAPVEDLFASFTDAPIGAASIGQVHRAVTKDGQPVAVKVQYPGIAATIRDDMKNVGALLQLARAKIPRARVDAYLEEMTRVIEQESDYLNEAANLERFQIVLKDVEGVRVPVPVHELTRKNVLVMELVEGTRLADWLEAAAPAERQRAGERLLRAYLHMMHTHGALHADPHPGNFLVDEQGRLAILDLGCVRDYPLSFTDGLVELLARLWKHDVVALQQQWRATAGTC